MCLQNADEPLLSVLEWNEIAPNGIPDTYAPGGQRIETWLPYTEKGIERKYTYAAIFNNVYGAKKDN